MLFLKLCKSAVPFRPSSLGTAANLGGQVLLRLLDELVPGRLQESGAVAGSISAPPQVVVHQSAELQRLVHGDEDRVGEIQLSGDLQEGVFRPIRMH